MGALDSVHGVPTPRLAFRVSALEAVWLVQPLRPAANPGLGVSVSPARPDTPQPPSCFLGFPTANVRAVAAVQTTRSAKNPASVSPSVVRVCGTEQGCGERLAGSSPGSFSSASPEPVTQAPAGEATYGWGVSRGDGNLSEGLLPRSHPPSPSWKEKNPTIV